MEKPVDGEWPIAYTLSWAEILSFQFPVAAILDFVHNSHQGSPSNCVRWFLKTSYPYLTPCKVLKSCHKVHDFLKFPPRYIAFLWDKNTHFGAIWLNPRWFPSQFLCNSPLLSLTYISEFCPNQFRFGRVIAKKPFCRPKWIQYRLKVKCIIIIIITSPAQSNLGRTMSQSPHWLQWDAPNSPPKLSFPLRWSPPHLIHPSLDRPHSPPQTGSGSIRPCCHSTLSGQTDRPTDTQTDRWVRRQVSKISC